MSAQDDGEPQKTGPQVFISPDQMGGVWANFARVSHSPHEFTLDFVRLDYAEKPPQGIVVARVSLSPLMVTQLIAALTDNWDKYAAKAMPREVRYESDDEPGGNGDDADRGPEGPEAAARDKPAG